MTTAPQTRLSPSAIVCIAHTSGRGFAREYGGVVLAWSLDRREALVRWYVRARWYGPARSEWREGWWPAGLLTALRHGRGDAEEARIAEHLLATGYLPRRDGQPAVEHSIAAD